MAVSQRVQVLTDEAEKLSLLKAYLDNPNLIKDLSEEVIKLNSLTKEKEENLSQAMKFLAEYEQKSTELSEATKALQNAISDFEKTKSDFTQTSIESNDLWQKKWSDLNSREMSIADAEKSLEKSWRDIGDQQKKLSLDVSSFQKEKDQIFSEIAIKKQENSEESMRLDELRKNLDKRAEKIRLREQASEL